MFVLHQGMDAAALGVTHDDDVLDLKVAHGEFHSGAGAVIIVVGLVGRDEVRHVPHDEQLARTDAEFQRRINARIRAGDHHGLGLLTLGHEIFDRLLVLAEVFRAELAVTLEERCEARPGFVGHPSAATSPPF